MNHREKNVHRMGRGESSRRQDGLMVRGLALSLPVGIVLRRSLTEVN